MVTTEDLDWRLWLAENLLRGVAPEHLCEVLAGQGLSATAVQAELAALVAHPAYRVARRLAHAVARSQSLDARARKLAVYTGLPPGIPRRANLSVEAFYREHVAPNTPVVLPDALAAWPALGTWSPAYFRARVGEARVRVMTGRDADPRYHQNQETNWVEMAMAAYADRVEAVGVSNDFYMVASNRNLARPELAPLMADLAPMPAVVEPTLTADRCQMWFGPAGTRTPLHRDTHPVLLCQVLGRKVFHLVQPREMALVLHEEGYYAPLDLEAPDLACFPDFADAEVLTVELGPGDALYIPWNWWHQARALDVSISVTLDQFRRPEDIRPMARCEGGCE